MYKIKVLILIRKKAVLVKMLLAVAIRKPKKN